VDVKQLQTNRLARVGHLSIPFCLLNEQSKEKRELTVKVFGKRCGPNLMTSANFFPSLHFPPQCGYVLMFNFEQILKKNLNAFIQTCGFKVNLDNETSMINCQWAHDH